MSSDEYFDDELDSAFLNEFDAIEAAHATGPAAASRRSSASTVVKPGSASKSSFKPIVVSKQPATPRPPLARKATLPPVIELNDSSDYGDAFDELDIDESDLAKIDQAVQRKYDAQQAAGPSNVNTLARRPSKGAQLNLFGEVAQDTSSVPKAGEANKRTFQRTRSTLRQVPLPGQAKKTKQWDRTAYAKTGWKKPKDAEKGKGKGRRFDEDEDEDDEPVEFEQFPAPEIPIGPIPPMKLHADRLAAKTWIYPLNKPRRDYQYNIVKKCLLENTLVALPTGLGKTFIAGVVMLNFYNWFPQGKVVFVAPTKPLVAQQIDACHKTCGIPGSAAAELTGDVTKTKRVNMWKTKRVFYATPQTLMNDLINGHADSTDIVLIVIDEAHKGTGDYAYAQVVRYMMRHNPHFRVLALTATPGGKPEVVQDIVDALHISHIEIRSESDPDLKKYLHTKDEQEHFVRMTEDVIVLRDALAALMTPILKKVQSTGFLKNGNVTPTTLHHFRCLATVQEMKRARAPPWAMSAASQLGQLARAMAYLMEMSIDMCYNYLKDAVEGGEKGGKNLRKAEAFTPLMKTFEEQATRGFSMHPKMDVLRTLLIDHFAQELPDDADNRNVPRHESRAMVFVSFRGCVEEIVELLNKESPMIRAKPFIGQGTDKQGKKGYAQKEQLEVINKFKAGEYNVLVSTSIGEEGLDIGEVDVIVCYDAQKTPIRMLQRIGRTGRKASGTVHILLAEGREEHTWQKAQSNYTEVQDFIVRASDLEVYGDVDRLLPDGIEPECIEMEMEIEEYVREDRMSHKDSWTTGDSPMSKGKKHKRDSNPMRNIPAVAAKGFVNVTDLLVKSGAKRTKTKKVEAVDIEHADSDDSDDANIEAGIFGPRRTKSAPAARLPQGKKALARNATIAGPSRKPIKKGAKQAILKQPDPVSSDDTDDEEIERGPLPSTKPPSGERVIDITTPPDSPSSRSAAAMLVSSPDRPLRNEYTIPVHHSRVDSSPERPLMSMSRSTSIRSRSNKLSQPRGSSNPPERSPSPSSRSISAERLAPVHDSMAWLVEDDEDPMIPELTAPPPRNQAYVVSDDEPLFLESSPPRGTSPPLPPSDDELEFDPPTTSPRRPASDFQQSPRTSGSIRKTDMGPPALPSSIVTISPSFSDEQLAPEPTFAVRAPGKQARKRIAAEAIEIESSPLSMPPPSKRRLQRDRPESPPPFPAQPPKKRKRKYKDIADAQRHNPLIDVEATHSDDELSVGSCEPDLIANSDDYLFLDEPPETQVSPSYDQSAVYRRSLMTQAPCSGGPAFTNGPVRRGQVSFGPNRAGPSRYRRAVTSSPTNGEELDQYEFDSFIVEDDAEVSLTNDPSSDF